MCVDALGWTYEGMSKRENLLRKLPSAVQLTSNTTPALAFVGQTTPAKLYDVKTR